MATLKIDEAIYVRLANYAGLTALTSTRIHKAVAVENATFPRVTYTFIYATPNHAMTGDVTTVSELLRVDVWADTYTSMTDVAAQVKSALRDYSGTITSGADDLAIDWIYYDTEYDVVGMDAEKRTEVYHRVLDFIVWY